MKFLFLSLAFFLLGGCAAVPRETPRLVVRDQAAALDYVRGKCTLVVSTKTESMRPNILPGDLLVVAPLQEPILPGQIFVYDNGHGGTTCHRAWLVNPATVLFFGDNNSRPDAWVPRGKIRWRVVLVVTWPR